VKGEKSLAMKALMFFILYCSWRMKRDLHLGDKLDAHRKKEG